MRILLLLLFLPLACLAQTVSIRNLAAGKDVINGSRAVIVDISITNEKTVPIEVDKRSFYLTNSLEKERFPLSPPKGVPDTSPILHLDPNQKDAAQLWFEVPPTMEVKTLKLCFHSFESKNWDDYLEILFSWPVSATAPMWHRAITGEPMDDRTYVPLNFKTNPAPKNQRPPKLLHAPDPEIPPGERQELADLGGKVTSMVSIVVDREGKPQQLQVLAPAGYGFDQVALEAVRQYRFKPAADASGATVPTQVQIQVTLRNY